MEKHCNYCKSSFEISNKDHWYAVKHKNGNIYYDCRIRRKITRQNFYKANKAEEKERSSSFRLENPEIVRKWKNQWALKNKDKISSYDKAYRGKNKDKISKRIKKWTKKNPEKVRGNHLKNKYWPELTLEEALLKYQDMAAYQNYTCKICDLPQTKQKRNFSVDHCHKTGRVRGLLCDLCNGVIVSIVENYPDLILKAQEYLKETNVGL